MDWLKRANLQDFPWILPIVVGGFCRFSFQHLSTTIGRFERHDQACLPAACGDFRGTCSLATEDPTSAGASALEFRVKRNAKSPTESW